MLFLQLQYISLLEWEFVGASTQQRGSINSANHQPVKASLSAPDNRRAGKDNSVCFLLPAAGNRNYNNGSLNNVGTNGNYWSSTVSGTNSYNLNFNSGSINPSNNNNRANGFSVRCLTEFIINK